MAILEVLEKEKNHTPPTRTHKRSFYNLRRGGPAGNNKKFKAIYESLNGKIL